MEAIESFIARLPKVELHVHLIGSAPVPTVLELSRRHPDSAVPRTEEGLRKFYEFRDFAHFIDVYKAVRALLTEPEDIADLVRGVARDLAAQNVRYAEFQDAPIALRRNGMPAAVITEALDAGARDALSQYELAGLAGKRGAGVVPRAGRQGGAARRDRLGPGFGPGRGRVRDLAPAGTGARFDCGCASRS